MRPPKKPCTRDPARTFPPMPATLKVALAQISPVWLDRTATVRKILDCLATGKGPALPARRLR